MSKWYKNIINKFVKKYCGILEDCHKVALKDLRFDQDDLPFVAVCSNSGSKKLVAEESDYNNKVKSYLKNKMGIDVLSIKLSLQILDLLQR